LTLLGRAATLGAKIASTRRTAMRPPRR